MAQLKSGSTAGGQIIATQDWVTANLIDAAPTALNTLNELAAALGDDPNFATTITNSIATKAPLSGSYGTDFYVNALYYDDWVRNHSNTNGIYWSTTGWHLYPESNLYFRVRSGNSGGAAIRFNTGGTDRNFIYVNNANEIGFLNTGGSWIFRVDNGGTLITGDIPWARLSSIPSTFAPSAHTHAISDVTGLQTALDGKQASGNYLTALPSHNHDDRYYTESESLSLFARKDTNSAIGGNLVIGNGTYGIATAYGNSGARLMFSGSDTDAQSNYYIGTNHEDYGGNYAKLDLRWHTGIRMGAQPGYGGIRFFNNEDLGSRIMSIGETDANVRIDNNLWIGGAGGWITDLLAGKQAAGSYAAASHTHDDRYYTESEVNSLLAGKQAAGSYAAASHEHDRTYITDSRGAARAPSYYDDRYAQWDFQNTSDTGVGGDSWHALLTVSKWASFDPSHRQEQLIFSGDHLWRRTANSDADWGESKKIWDSGNLNPIVSATVSNDTTTFTKADGSTFALTTSDANTNKYLNGASFNTADGVLTLTVASGTTITVDLDGRYLESLPAHNHDGVYLAAGGKAADSNLLDGLDLHTGRNNEANKVVRTDGNGYIQAGWINTPSGATTSTLTKIYASQDDYIRYVTPAEFRRQITDGVYQPAGSYQAAGSYAASDHNHTYNVNDSWLRDNGDNANVKLYGNTRQMAFRTDGTTEYAAGVGGYAFAWMYGGDASGNRRMLLGSDGRLWTSYHGWLDSAFASASHNHTGVYAAASHDHAISEIRDLQAELDSKQAAGSYAAASHTHTASQVGLGNVSNAAQVTTSYNSSLNSDSRNSRGVTRLYRRDSDSDYSVQTYWTGARWRLYGYNGDSNHADTHVGYADSAGSASSATSATSASTATNLSGGNVTTSGNNLYIYNSGAENYRLHHNGAGGVFDSHAQFAIRPASTDFPEYRFILQDWVGFFWLNVDPWGDNWGVGPNPYSWHTVNRGSFLTFGIEDWSDRRHKSAITEIDNAIDKVKAISGYTYWKRGSEVKEAGVVAQDVLEVFPEAVGGNEDGYSIKPSALIGLLSKAVKEQQEMIDALTARIEALENK